MRPLSWKGRMQISTLNGSWSRSRYFSMAGVSARCGGGGASGAEQRSCSERMLCPWRSRGCHAHRSRGMATSVRGLLALTCLVVSARPRAAELGPFPTFVGVGRSTPMQQAPLRPASTRRPQTTRATYRARVAACRAGRTGTGSRTGVSKRMSWHASGTWMARLTVTSTLSVRVAAMVKDGRGPRSSSGVTVDGAKRGRE
jgi:hypothetical protein